MQQRQHRQHRQQEQHPLLVGSQARMKIIKSYDDADDNDGAVDRQPQELQVGQ